MYKSSHDRRGSAAAAVRRHLTFSFSIRDGMKLFLSAGRLVTGWIMVSWVKKSTDGCKNKTL